MKNNYSRTIILLVAIVIFSIGGKNVVFAQSADDGKRYNLAVYTTGTQNDQTLSISLQNVIQNRTITKLTGEGRFRLIERSGEFLKQIQSEQTMQQSGDVADGQIAEIGAGYGAEKICVVSVSIINQYLYIATRIVDVATKTSFESGDAEINNYNSIPLLTKTLETALNKMLAMTARTILTNTSHIQDSQKKEETEKPKTELKPSKVENKPVVMSTGSYTKADYDAYKKMIKGESCYLDLNSMAYKEYLKFRKKAIAGGIFCGIGTCFFTIGVSAVCMTYSPTPQANGYAFIAIGAASIVVGSCLLATMNKHLQKSFQYYFQGEKQTATLNFHPYFGSQNTLGAGLTLRF